MLLRDDQLTSCTNIDSLTKPSVEETLGDFKMYEEPLNVEGGISWEKLWSNGECAYSFVHSPITKATHNYD